MQKRNHGKIIMENINSNYETGKKESAIIAFFEIYRFLNTKENKNFKKKYLITIFDFFPN
jgi:hypothetical protein